MFVNLLALGLALSATTIDTPETRRGDTVDVYHGVEVRDPYRWLEADVREAPEVSDWVDAQNEVTFGYLEQIEHRKDIRRRLEQLWDYEKSSSPRKVGDKYYLTRNDGLQNQSVWYVLDDLDATPRVLLDPNTLSEDGTIALSGAAFSDDGRYFAYALSEGGSDWKTWHVMDLATGETLPDRVKWSKFSGAAWLPDGSGFFYARFPEPEAGTEMVASNLNQALFFHRTGTPQSEDVLVHEDPEHPQWGWDAAVTEDGNWLVVHAWKGGSKDRVYVRDLRSGIGPLRELVPNWDDAWSLVGNDGDVLFFRTDKDAPMYRLVSIDMADPQASFKTLIPERQALLRGASQVGGHLVANWLQDATSRVSVHDLVGTEIRTVDLPGIGSAGGFGGRDDDPETFFSFSSFTTPPAIHRYNVATGESSLWWQPKVAFDPDNFSVSQVFVQSDDGTMLPMFIAHRADLVRDGSNPTLLYGYGGFNVNLTPYFSPSRLAWMEMGGVFAMPNLRGGGEYGKAWHEAGTKLQKQNVFDDFMASARWLINNGYTDPSHLAIQGGSNGGLLVGACITQHPELFGAALPAVGVMDMIRYPKFTIGRAWVPDYGDPEVQEEFEALIAYSPYHNCERGKAYPPTLITTGDTDDRVVPGHSFKFAAALQHAQAGDAPVLIRVNRKAGHGAGKPTSMRLDETADMWSFLAEHIGVNPVVPPVLTP
ncbi:MAG: prolyl oligopeptidase family serine peptidase [Phycisphaerales bacterium]|nr:prolyl oligopeptidase family serine peptidase [Phycisphaerales bacterium]